MYVYHVWNSAKTYIFQEIDFTPWILFHPMFLLTWWHHFNGSDFLLKPLLLPGFYLPAVCIGSSSIRFCYCLCSAARKFLVIESMLHLRWPGRVIRASPTSCRKILCGNRIMGLFQGAECYFYSLISIVWLKKNSNGMFCIPQSCMTQFWAESLPFGPLSVIQPVKRHHEKKKNVKWHSVKCH